MTPRTSFNDIQHDEAYFFDRLKDGTEILIPNITMRGNTAMIAAVLGACRLYGDKRIVAAIRSTYSTKDASEIISSMAILR